MVENTSGPAGRGSIVKAEGFRLNVTTSDNRDALRANNFLDVMFNLKGRV
jgi:hypothetical protein